MPHVVGPYLTRTVHVPAHDVEVFDDAAYWHLDWTGALAEPDPDDDDQDPADVGTHLYAKVAYPTPADAQAQHRMMALARDEERRLAHERTKADARARRAALKARPT